LPIQPAAQLIETMERLCREPGIHAFSWLLQLEADAWTGA